VVLGHEVLHTRRQKQRLIDIPGAKAKRSRVTCPSAPGARSNGGNERLSSRFALVRVRVAHRDYQLTDNRPEEWLLIEWPEGEKEPSKYWLSTLPEGITFRRLVDFAKLRWRIERDYQELKQEVGLGHFEGRGWRGAGAGCKARGRRLRLSRMPCALCQAAVLP